MPAPGYRKTHCKNGHEIAVVGRYVSGRCRGCLVKDAKPLGAPKLCGRGHDLANNRVMHSGRARGCLTCHREREAAVRAGRAAYRVRREQQRARAVLLRSCVPTQPLLDLLARRNVSLKRVSFLVGERLGTKPTSVDRLLHRAVEAGAFTIAAADQICVGLDVHPTEVWGSEWFTYGQEMADAV